jgi:23S rRNA (guanosine2251-2'-O)-methyltransferase
MYHSFTFAPKPALLKIKKTFICCVKVCSMPFRKLTMPELERPDTDVFRATEKQPIVVILDEVRSGLNVGSIFRTCDAFAVQELALCGITVQPPHKEILKTALGSANSVSWQYFEQTVLAVQHYKAQGYRILAVEQAVPRTFLQDFQSVPSEKCAFVFGNEVDGVSDAVLALCDEVLEIPQFGTKHSINVAVSVGIVLWERIRTNSMK